MVNRNSYLSLIESVNEAVVGKTTKTSAGKPVTSQVANTVAKGTPGGSGIQWGDPSIGGAKNGAELAAWLNKQSGGSSTPTTAVKGGVADAQSASVSKVASIASTIAGSRPGTTAIAPKGKVTKASATNTTVAEEWDEVDEILAEALEMFGEEDLVAILENFEETGELPQEFIDLIDSING